jgi:hypothetical protein
MIGCLSILSVLDEGYSRNASCALSLISTFYLLKLTCCMDKHFDWLLFNVKRVDTVMSDVSNIKLAFEVWRLPSSDLALMTSLKTAIVWPRLDDEFEDCHPLAPGRKLLSFVPSGCCLPATIFNAIQFY